LDSQATFLEVRNDKYSMGITAGHAPIVSTVSISKMKIRFPVGEYVYATSGGIINVTKEKVTLILDSIERSDEIDIDRANKAKKRAQDRLDNIDQEIDVARAKLALLRAINRIDIKQNN
jgi:F-type H+-transporting ATPase subunit epsilon